MPLCETQLSSLAKTDIRSSIGKFNQVTVVKPGCLAGVSQGVLPHQLSEAYPRLTSSSGLKLYSSPSRTKLDWGE